MSEAVRSGSVPSLPCLQALRYVQPLREGGSLPAIVDTRDGLFVTKWRGAGQGPRALLAELVVGLLARVAELPVPDLALIAVAPEFGRSEPDPEIQDVLRASEGMNVGLRYLDGAFNFDDHAAGDLLDADFAADVVWFDALVTNPDRTARNPNLLIWRRTPWLIDHGAALYAHHDWAAASEARTRTRFELIDRHVLLTRAADIAAADARLAPRFTDDAIADVAAALPDALLADPVAREPFDSADRVRARYAEYLRLRLQSPRPWVDQAVEARERRLREPPQRLEARR